MKKKLVTIGGGKGQAAILKGLRKFDEEIEISAIVSMVDNGGSTGRLSEEIGIPPFGGDFRDVLTALANNEVEADLWQHRYEHGQEIKGHTVGNLILLGLLEKRNWNIPEAIKDARKLLDIETSSVYASTNDRVQLVAEYKNGEIVKGQDEIDNNMDKKFQYIEKVHLEPDGQIDEGAERAIKEADMILLCPGDIYGSLICNLVVSGVSEAINQSNAEIVYITNLMTKVNQTHNWKASEFINEIQRYLPRKIDHAIINNGQLSSDIAGMEQYKEEHWEMVEDDLGNKTEHNRTHVISESIWFEGEEFKRVSTDVIPRSFIRHNPAKIAEIVMELIHAQ